MKKWVVLLFTVFISTILLGACSEESSETQNENNADTSPEVVNNDEANENNEEEEINNEDNDKENTETQELEEETFADEVTVLDVDEVFLDQEEPADFDVDGEVPLLVEHEELTYVEFELVTSLLDKEITYDPEEKVAEVFDEKGDFTYQPEHEDEEGALIEVGQYFLESIDDYFAPADDEDEQYNFLEYEGNLYLPQRLIMKQLETPVNYIRRDHKLEFGEQGETTDIYDLGTENSYDRVYATDKASDVTIDGENYEQGIKLTEIDTISRDAEFKPDSKYSNFSGFVYHKEGDDPMEFRFLDSEKDTIEVIDTIEQGEKAKFDFDISGMDKFYISAENTKFKVTDMEGVIIGELK